MWNWMMEKVHQIMNSLPEEMRIMVIQKYSVGEPKSPRVKKVLKIIEWLKPEEKDELNFFIWDILSTDQEEDGERTDTGE